MHRAGIAERLRTVTVSARWTHASTAIDRAAWATHAALQYPRATLVITATNVTCTAQTRRTRFRRRKQNKTTRAVQMSPAVALCAAAAPPCHSAFEDRIRPV